MPQTKPDWTASFPTGRLRWSKDGILQQEFVVKSGNFWPYSVIKFHVEWNDVPTEDTDAPE